MTRLPLAARAALPCAAALLALLSASSQAATLGGTLTDTLGAVRSTALIPNQYIVSLRKPPAGDRLAGLSVASQASALLANVGGGKLLYVYEYALRGFAVQMTPLQADLLRLNPLVARIEQDQQMKAVATQSGATWGLDRIDQRNRPLNGSYTYPDQAGSGVHVYVIDTGLNPNHSEFSGRVGSGRNFVAGGLLGLGGVDPNAWTDCHGHGTHVSGTAAGTTWGVAKKATVHAIRVLNCQGSGSNSAVIAGIDYVTQNHANPAVANMSLGGGDSASLDTAVRNAVNAGVTMAVAAGNDNANACSGSPNKEPLAITVGATTSSDARASYSNYGSCLDLFAPGSSITSANYSSNSGSTTMSGTSMASPHVAGVAALVLGAHPGYTPAQVAAQLVADSTANVLSSVGTGSPNRLLYTGGSGGTDTPPIASFTASCTNLGCSFNGAASSDDHGIAAYSWTFGDGSGGNGVSLSHSYAAAGSYSVKLTVTDTVGQIGTQTQTVNVSSAGSGPCSDCSKVSGSLANGATAYSPGSSGFSSGGGQFKGYLRGPAGTDFDLYLEKLSSGLLGSSWSVVAKGDSPSNNEDVIYSGTAGSYRWRLKSYSGSGSYDFYFKNP